MKLVNQSAVITGGASGIGRETALLFAAEGASVVIADVNDDAGAQTVQDIVDAGGKAVYQRADVSQSGDCEAMIRRAEDEFGKLSILFNNAGIHAQRGRQRGYDIRRKSGISRWISMPRESSSDASTAFPPCNVLAAAPSSTLLRLLLC